MALAEAMRPPSSTVRVRLVDHYTYVIAGDGDLMEGVSHEAFSLRGHLKLHKLIVFSIPTASHRSSTGLACTDDVQAPLQGL
jgi:transketolase